MQKVTTVGGIAIDDDRILVVKLDNDRFAIPKGHKEADETDEQTALREVEEETGVITEIISYLGELTRRSKEKNGDIVEKTIKVYKLRKAGLSDIKPDENSQWVNIDTAAVRMQFQEEVNFIKAHYNELLTV